MVQNEKIVGLINGWFDLIHPGHFLLFQEAKKHCTYLIVAINHDSQWKKPRQRLFSHDERKFMLEQIKHIDEVIIFDEPTPINIINSRKIHKHFKGVDYENTEFTEKQLLTNLDIEIIYLPVLFHSSQLVDKLNK